MIQAMIVIAAGTGSPSTDNGDPRQQAEDDQYCGIDFSRRPIPVDQRLSAHPGQQRQSQRDQRQPARRHTEQVESGQLRQRPVERVIAAQRQDKSDNDDDQPHGPRGQHY